MILVLCDPRNNMNLPTAYFYHFHRDKILRMTEQRIRCFINVILFVIIITNIILNQIIYGCFIIY